MDPVSEIGEGVKMRVDALGAEIIRFAGDKREALASEALSAADKATRIESSRDLLRRHMNTVFGQGSGSIRADILQLLEASDGQAAGVRGRLRKAADIWLEALPELRQFLEYCAGMIEAHPGSISPQVRESQKCLTEATMVLGKISDRVERELGETP